MGALPNRADRQRLMSRLTASRPSVRVTQWLQEQPPEVRRRHADLRLRLGGQSAAVVGAQLATEGWDIPAAVLTEMAEEIASAPQYTLNDCGDGYVVLDGAKVTVHGFTPNFACLAAS